MHEHDLRCVYEVDFQTGLEVTRERVCKTVPLSRGAILLRDASKMGCGCSCFLSRLHSERPNKPCRGQEVSLGRSSSARGAAEKWP
ncbi:hypothetical protein E2C01_002958 [Portunus trituberculatus]|uniref:Uncharacterized protein n=1 Tax=Portunus trituberculatus TaxID=210409 RepID=A0A5B7CNW2_PORTR|nr:hypothetical protein [Portunus trituberculatus]